MSELVYSPNGVFTEQRDGGRQAKGQWRKKLKNSFCTLAPHPHPQPPVGLALCTRISPFFVASFFFLSCYFMFILLLLTLNSELPKSQLLTDLSLFNTLGGIASVFPTRSHKASRLFTYRHQVHIKGFLFQVTGQAMMTEMPQVKAWNGCHAGSMGLCCTFKF